MIEKLKTESNICTRVSILLLLLICPMINFEKHIQTIHFIETTIGTKHLKISQKCALESAKKYHPYANIILWSLENKLVDDYIENRIIDCKNLQLNESQILYMCKYIPIIENGGLLFV